MAEKLDPFDVAALEKSLNDSATRVSTIWVSFLIFSLYLLIAAATIEHRQLFLAEPVKLPVLNIDLPLWGFFFLAPILFVIFHSYVLIQVLLLGRTAAAYNDAVDRGIALAADKGRVRQRLANTLFAQIFSGSPREREGWFGWLLKAMAWITLAIAPILILLVFQFMFLPYHSHLATWTHRLLILAELAAVFWLWPLVLDPRRDFAWSKIRRRMKRTAALPLRLLAGRTTRRHAWRRLRHDALPLGSCLLFMLVSLSVATFPGEPHVNLTTGHAWPSVQCDRWFARTFDRLNLPQLDVVDDEKLKKIEEGTKAAGEPPYQGERTRNLRGRDLNCGTFSDYADLRRVDLTAAQLHGAMLDRAKLQGASLDGAQLQGVSLGRAQLQGATLNGVKLQGASLDQAQLQGADLVEANLPGADLRQAQLQGANLKGVRLQGADLRGAQLQGANFEGTQLQGSDLASSVMTHAVLRNAFVWRAKNAACENDRAHVRNPILQFLLKHDSQDPRKLLPPSNDDEVGQIIELLLENVPQKKQAAARERMRSGLIVDPKAKDTAEIAKVWSDCEQATREREEKTPGSFDRDHARLLRDLVCNEVKNRTHIAVGIVRHWISDESGRQAFSALLARTLLDQDGKDCSKDLDDATRERLLSFLPASERASKSPASFE